MGGQGVIGQNLATLTSDANVVVSNVAHLGGADVNA